jgi:mRNA interferase MazF
MKQFDAWNGVKKHVESRTHINIKEGQIYYAYLGENIGFEQSGKGSEFFRPVVVFKVFSNTVFWALPLSTTERRGKYYFEFSFRPHVTSVAILSQVKLMDTKRLYDKIGRMKKVDFDMMKIKFVSIVQDGQAVPEP